MARVHYTESHYQKPLGSERADSIIELSQDDLEDGIEMQVIPGQILPEDKFYQAERAQTAAEAGLLDPLSYFEALAFDDPHKQTKRLIMWQMNPLSIIDLDDDDIAKLQQASQIFNPGEGGGFIDQRAQQVAQLTQQLKTMSETDEFKVLSQEEQIEAVDLVKQQIEKLSQAK